MKKQLALVALLGAIDACQPQAAQTTAAVAAAPSISAAAAQPALAAKAALPVLVAPDSLTPAMRATLRKVDLTKLFLAPEAPQTEGYQTALDGFVGTSPQRLSLAILTATRDSRRPELLHITGKVRYQKQVTAFTGELCVVKIIDFYDQSLLLSQGGDEFIQDTTSGDGRIINAKAYTATAAFQFIDSTSVAQVLTGRALLDFWIMDNGTVGTLRSPAEGIVLAEAGAKGSGLVLQGKWQQAVVAAAKPFLVSRDVFLISPALISDFGVGDRGAGINPKYAKFGWNTYWKNDEWWASSPKPSLNL